MKTSLLLFLVLGYQLGRAQYFGTSGDGHDQSGIVGTRIDGVILLNSVLFQGGVGDGFSESRRNIFLSPGSFLGYAGGSGDGYIAKQITTSLNGITILEIYAGGDSDGFSVKDETLILSGANLATIYAGGSDDGFDIDGLQISLSGSILALFDGGDGDGHTRLLITDFVMGGGNLEELFMGGPGDGFALMLLDPNSLSGLPLTIYNGGDRDGISVGMLEGFIFQALPVEWISFEAKRNESVILLQWSTATEINNDRFEVERSLNSLEFKKIAELEGAGNSSNRRDYSIEDMKPLKGLNYYRVKQIDFDGQYSYTEVKSVLFNELPEPSLNIYPNPNKNRILNLEITGISQNNLVYLAIHDSKGQLVKYLELKAGDREIDLPWDWPAGSYNIQVTSGNIELSKNLIIVD